MVTTNDIVLKEQLELLYKALPLSVIANIVNGYLLYYFISDQVASGVADSWLVVLFVISLLRLLSYIAWKKSDFFAGNLKKTLLVFNVGVTLSSLTWGFAASALFVADDVVYQVFLAFIIAGMSAGAASSLSFLRFPIMIFLSVTLVPLFIEFLLVGEAIAYAMAIMIGLFILIMLTTVNRTYNQVKENIVLRIDASKKEKQIRESEERFRSIFEASPVGILQYDSNGDVISSNNAAARIFSLSLSEIQSVNLLKDVIDEEFTSRVKNSFRGSLELFSGDTSVVNTKSKTPIHVLFKSLRDWDDKMSGGIAIVEDASEQARLEKLKSEFVSTVSHELRTPLTAIKGSIDLLQIVPDDKKQELYDMLKRNTNRLVLLINDLLDMEKIISGNLHFNFQTYSTNDLLLQVIEDNQGYAREKNTTIQLKGKTMDGMIQVDKDRFNQIMANLISNACKFTADGTFVEIGVEQNNHTMAFHVTDHGPGIPESFKEKLFERFTQADSTNTRAFGGTGLGLYITKQLVEAMNGEINYVSDPKAGTTFTVSFKAM